MTFPRRGTLIEPGLYDEGGALHFYPAEYLEGHGIPVTDENLATIERAMKEHFAVRYPGVPIHDEYEH